MAQAYFSLVTTAGKIKLAQSAAGGDSIVITHFAIGDGNGADTNPTAASTALVREVWRTPVESVVTDPDNPSAVLVTAIIPTTAGGWWMREFGIFDQAGVMIAVAKPVSQYKPTALEGQLEDIRYEFQLIIGENANVTLLVDPSLIFATRAWVEARKITMTQISPVPWVPVISVTLSSAPGAPSQGDAYLIPVGATGVWSAQIGKIAEWTGSVWSYVSPPDGHGIGLPDGRLFVRIGGSYVELRGTTTRKGLVRLATLAEALAGVDTEAAISAFILKSVLAAPAAGRAANFKITKTSARQVVAGVMPTVFTASLTKLEADSKVVLHAVLSAFNRTINAGVWVAEIALAGQTLRTTVYGVPGGTAGGAYPVHAAFEGVAVGTHTVTIKIGRSTSAAMDLVVNPSTTDDTAYGVGTESVLSSYEVL